MSYKPQETEVPNSLGIPYILRKHVLNKKQPLRVGASIRKSRRIRELKCVGGKGGLLLRAVYRCLHLLVYTPPRACSMLQQVPGMHNDAPESYQVSDVHWILEVYLQQTSTTMTEGSKQYIHVEEA